MQISKTDKNAKKIWSKALATANANPVASPFLNPNLPHMAHTAAATQTKVKKNRFQPESSLRLLASLAAVSGNWSIEDFSDEGKSLVILSQNVATDPARLVLSVEDETVKLESLSYKMVQSAPVKSRWSGKPKPSVAVRTEVKKTLTASKRSELNHLEDHIISFG